jgi:hypothetical protein
LSYPIGSFLFWKPEAPFSINDEIGPWKLLPEKKVELQANTHCQYVLDGFQRLSSLFGCLINPNEDNTNFNLDQNLFKQKFALCYNLKDQNFEIPRGNESDRDFYVLPLYALIDTYEFLSHATKIRTDARDENEFTLLIDRARTISKIFSEYQIPVIEIKGGEIEEAVEIFTRLNQAGKKISPDWFVSARTYQGDFRFGTKIDELLPDLKEYNFEDKGKENIIRELVFRCIQSSFGELYFKVKVEDLIEKPNFQEVTVKSIESIKKAVKFLYEDLLVIDGKLLPARMQLIFITEFFNQIESPTDDQLESLKKWFWITSYSNYFTVYSPSKRSEAFDLFREYLRNQNQGDIPVFNDKPELRFKIPDLPKKINFGSVRAKTYILFLLNHANGFRKVNSEDIEGLKLFNLFKKGEYKEHPGNLIPLIEFIDQDNPSNKIPITKVKDLHLWLLEENDYSSQFITPDLQQNQHNYQFSEEMILNRRFSLIRSAEIEFTNSFDLLEY